MPEPSTPKDRTKAALEATQEARDMIRAVRDTPLNADGAFSDEGVAIKRLLRARNAIGRALHALSSED